uniref:hypothetical protein n=1 Tax=Acidicapsa ligni TaxID=542300 RepID=UPI0037C0BD39
MCPIGILGAASAKLIPNMNDLNRSCFGLIETHGIRSVPAQNRCRRDMQRSCFLRCPCPGGDHHNPRTGIDALHQATDSATLPICLLLLLLLS